MSTGILAFLITLLQRLRNSYLNRPDYLADLLSMLSRNHTARFTTDSHLHIFYPDKSINGMQADSFSPSCIQAVFLFFPSLPCFNTI